MDTYELRGVHHLLGFETSLVGAIGVTSLLKLEGECEGTGLNFLRVVRMFLAVDWFKVLEFFLHSGDLTDII